ncbi:MAG: hypothetical protein A2W22_06135 [Candidatus Levybacteria bacterium RBG_16_35_11]|nr:MAG: hypothetical protein A2W22_06135 [Candidatus Levybacteria bacterium RBG_16_35_11]
MLSECTSVIATFATLGFIIVLGLPAVLSYAWTMIRLREPKRIEILTDYSIRFISMFSGKKIFLTFFVLGLLFILSGLLCLFYYLYPEVLLIEIAIWMQIVAMTLAFCILCIIALKTHLVTPKEIRDVIDYADAIPVSKP